MSDFGWALNALRSNQRVSRSGWNGKGMWLTYVQYWSGTFATDVPGRPGLPFIAMKTAQGDIVPWLASQTDVLALDWEYSYV